MDANLHFVSGRSSPSVSSWRTDGDSLPAARRRRCCVRRTAGSAAATAVPVAQRQLLALEGGEREIGALDERERAWPGPRVLARAAASPTMRAALQACMSSGVMKRWNSPHETVLQLHCAPLVEGGVPGRRHEAGRARDRPRVPGAIGQIAREDLALVGGDEHVIVRRALRQHRHLALDLDDAAVGAARAAGVLEFALLDDLRAEAGRGVAQGGGEQFVAFRASRRRAAICAISSRSDIARARRRAWAGRRDMDHIGAAILLAQPIVGRAGVEHEEAPRLGGGGGFEHALRVEVADQNDGAGVGERADRRARRRRRDAASFRSSA